MNVVIRADASQHIGSGHIMRCLVLARELREQGFCVKFACIPLCGNLIHHIECEGFAVVKLTEPNSITTPKSDKDYLGWLQKTPEEDARDFLNQVDAVDLVVTDHYAIQREWQSTIKRELNCYIVAIDDLLREHDADLLLDQTLGRKPSDYPAVLRVLAGSEFALLAPYFKFVRQTAYSRSRSDVKTRILVSMGGVDNPNATLQVLEVIAKRDDFEILVLLSPKAPHYSVVKNFCAQHRSISHLDFAKNMAELMLQYDIAVGAPGTTAWERAALGLPSVLVPLADNQREIANQLVKNHAAICISLEALGNDLLDSIDCLNRDWNGYVARNLRLCDGLGVYRVSSHIVQLLNPDKCAVFLRNATKKDTNQVYTWQCHPNTRKYALNKTIPTYAEHCYWMNRKLQSVVDYFYVIVDDQQQKDVGVVRLDLQESGYYLVSIFVDPKFYGKGIALKALKQVDLMHGHMFLEATVLEKNVASHKLFSKAGYTKLNSKKYIRLPLEQ